MYTVSGIFILLSVISVMSSGAPFKVHSVNVTALFIAFFIPNLLAKNKENKKRIIIWLSGSIIGMFYLDLLSSLVIVKKEIFFRWYISYPVGIAFILILQALTKYIDRKLFSIRNEFMG